MNGNKQMDKILQMMVPYNDLHNNLHDEHLHDI